MSTLQPAERPIFWGFVRTAPAERDMAAIAAAVDAVTELWRILDRHLDGRTFAEGERFTLADVALAAYARRWFGIAEIERPSMPNLEGWYRRTSERRGFERYLAPPLT